MVTLECLFLSKSDILGLCCYSISDEVILFNKLCMYVFKAVNHDCCKLLAFTLPSDLLEKKEARNLFCRIGIAVICAGSVTLP